MLNASKAGYVRRIAAEYSEDLDLSQEEHELAQEVIAKSMTGARIREAEAILSGLLRRFDASFEVFRVSNIFADIKVRRTDRDHPEFKKVRKKDGRVFEFVEGPRGPREEKVHELLAQKAQEEYLAFLDQLASGDKDPRCPHVREQIKEFEVLRVAWGLTVRRRVETRAG